jgi:hypothetical protein
VAFFAGVTASSFCIHLFCLVCIQSVVRGVWSRFSSNLWQKTVFIEQGLKYPEKIRNSSNTETSLICAILKMDQKIAETTVLLAGLILSDWFESQMPCWCLNNCKGKSYCDSLSYYIPINMMKHGENTDYCQYHGHQIACMWHRCTQHSWDQWILHTKFWAQENISKHCHSKTELTSIFGKVYRCSRTKYREMPQYITPLNVFPVESLLVFNTQTSYNVISGFCHDVDEIYILLGYCVVYSGNSLSTFPALLIPMKMGPLRCPEMLVKNYHCMLHDILEECKSLHITYVSPKTTFWTDVYIGTKQCACILCMLLHTRQLFGNNCINCLVIRKWCVRHFTS